MPHRIEKRDGKFVVVNTATRDVKGTHTSRRKAQRQLNLVRAVKHGFKPTGAPARK